MDTWKLNCDILKKVKKVYLDEISGNKFWCKSVDLQKFYEKEEMPINAKFGKWN
jgi:hypothetical protein